MSNTFANQNSSHYSKSSIEEIQYVMSKPKSYSDFKTSPSPRLKVDSRSSFKTSKRSASESNMRPDVESSLNLVSESDLFKSRSNRNLTNNGKLIKTYIKNQNQIRIYESVPSQHMPPLHITNQEEVKRNLSKTKYRLF